MRRETRRPRLTARPETQRARLGLRRELMKHVLKFKLVWVGGPPQRGPLTTINADVKHET